ncbi:MAG: Fe-S cluster assembly protein SufD [Cyclobacteriaceae bacterium]|nr:Fe-S cluster assembly protein SufD [Cyclobacteriaceae bacterium]
MANSVLERLLQKPEGNGFDAVREKATSLIKEKGLPGKKNEEYKYTNLSRLLEKNFTDFEGNKEANLELLKSKIPTLSTIQLVYVNGNLSEELSSYTLPKGIELEALAANADSVDENADEFALLNASNLKNGTSITFTKGFLVETPIVILHITDSSKNQAASHPRLAIKAEENAQATIVELFLGNGDATSFTNAVTEIQCKGHSLLTYIKVGNENDNQLHVGNTKVDVAGNAVFNAITANFGGQMVRNNLRIALHESYSEAHLFGLYMSDEKEHIDNHTVVDHQMPNCDSNELYKGIMNGSSTGVFNGKIYVQQDAQKTNAFQSNKNILLSDNAAINTKPQLEIWADDVKCSHGCTTGKLDKEQLFYLKSRGIDEQSAKTLLITAFANEILEQIKSKEVRAYVQNLLHNKIGG